MRSARTCFSSYSLDSCSPCGEGRGSERALKKASALGPRLLGDRGTPSRSCERSRVCPPRVPCALPPTPSR